MSNDSIVSALKTVTSAIGEDGGDEPNPRRFLDLAVFYKTLDTLGKVPGNEKMDPVGRRLATAHLDEFLGLCEKYLEPVLDVRGFQSLKPKWRRLKQPKKTETTFRKRGAFVAAVYSTLRTKKAPLLRDMFNGPDLMGAKQFCGCHQETAEAEMEALAAVNILGGTTRTKLYVKQALENNGHVLDNFDKSMGEMVEARNLGAEIRKTEVAINNTDPTDFVQQEELKARSQDLKQQVKKLASESGAAAAVEAVAMAEASKSMTNHSSRTGQELGLSQSQEDAMMVRGKSVIGAGAGSGKTRVLAGKVVYHIKELGVRPDQIIATSFSAKSAYELTERIRKYGGEGILPEDSLDGFGTTHSVSGKLLDRFANRGYGAVPALSGGQQKTLVEMAMKQVEMRATAGNVPDMVEEGLFDKALLARRQALEEPVTDSAPAEQTAPSPEPDGPEPELTWEEAVERVRQYHIDNPNVNYAGLRVGISTTILKYGKKPSDLSPKQRTGMQYAFKEAGIEYKRSPNGGHRLLRGGAIQPPAAPAEVVETDEIVTASGQVVSGAKSQFWKQPANQWFNFGDKKVWEDAKGQRVSPKTVLLAISQWKANLQSPSDAAKAGGDAFAACYAAYEWLKKNDPAAPARRDHDDVLIEACQTLIAKPSALSRMKAEKKFILVDEAQDLNKAQHLLFGLIAGYYDPETQKPNEDGSMNADTYCFIGDDKQAIYEFRGADPDVFIELSTVHGFDTKLLEMNYRSGSAIVDAANKLIAHNTKQIPMVCEANPSRGMGNIQATGVETHLDGAAQTAQEIEAMVNSEDAGISPADFGVACRTNAEMHAYCMELTVRGIPFRCPKIQLFNDRTSKALINWLSLATTSESDTTKINKIVLEAHTAPRFSLDKRFNDHLQKAAKGQNYLTYLENGGWQNVYPEDQAWRNKRNVLPYVRALRQMKNFNGSPAEALTAVMSLQGTFDPATGGAASIMESLIAQARKDSEIMELLHEEAGEGEVTDEMVKDAAMAPVAPLMSLLERYEDLNLAVDYVQELQAANKRTQKKGAPKKANQRDTEYETPAVVIDTVHGWKGLEADHMYVPMPGGVFPHAKSGPEEIASERRLAYVAITRGRDSVKIICPKLAHNGKPAGVSSFVGEACVPLAGGAQAPADEGGDDGEVVASLETPTLWEDIKAELENERALRTAQGATSFSSMVLESFSPEEPQD